LGNTKGFYCISDSGRSELQGIGEFLSPKEFYWKELIRSLKVQKRIGKNLLLGISNKVAILSTNIELRTDMAKILHFLKDTFALQKRLA
jgi:hypothetical protein